MRIIRRGRAAILALAWLLSADVLPAQETSTASLEGSLTDAESGMPVVGAIVQVGSFTAVTAANGVFRFENLPAGRQVAVISAPRHRPVERLLELSAGANQLPVIMLQPETLELESLEAIAPASEAQSKFEEKVSSEALTESLSEAALKNSNAQSGADLVKDVSGVSVSKGANGASNVSVRGIDQRMLRITVDGQRQGGTGNPLDNIPPEIVQSLEVTKTFTPDMEADAVGGTININTGGVVLKTAYKQGRHQVIFNSLESRPSTRNSLTLGQPFKLFSEKRNASFVVTGSFEDQYKLRERVSTLREWTPQISPGPAPYTGLEIPVLTLPLIESTHEHRQRTGLVVNGDAVLGDTSLFLRSNFSGERTRRDRDLNDTNPAAGTPLFLTPAVGVFSGVPLSRRNQDQISRRDAANVSFGGKSKIGRAEVDATFAYAFTREDEPHTFETGFLSDHTYRMTYDLAPNPYAPVFAFLDETNPTDTTSASDPARYRLDYVTVTQADTEDEEASAKLNVKINLRHAGKSGDYLKFGGKVQQRRRLADTDRDVFDAGAQALTMTGLVGTPVVAMDTLDYRFGPMPDARDVFHLRSTTPAAFQENTTQTLINSNTGDSSVTENVWALYGMGKFEFKPWTVLGGVRVEGTHVNSSGKQMLLDANGQLDGFASVRAVNDYVEVLPGLHLRYEPKPGLLYRGSVTRSLSRPNSADIAPFRTLSFIDHRSRVGAPDLKPYQSTNLDVSVDKYSDRYGLVSFAAFYKTIDHFITDAQYPTTIGDLGEFIEFKRVNGEAARAMGFELNWQSPEWSLPFGFKKGSIEADYSFNHGEAHHPTRPNETFPLPRQVDHQASLKFHGEHGALSIDASLRYRSRWWEDLIAVGFDNYITDAWDAEISAVYKIGKNTRITAGVSNPLNRPTRHFAGTPSRMNDSQINGVEMNAGVQWKL
jgi:TonB-dependent receptor